MVTGRRRGGEGGEVIYAVGVRAGEILGGAAGPWGDVVELSVSGMDGEMYHLFFGEVPADGRRYCRGRMADGVGLTGIWTGRDPSAGRGLPEAMSSCHDVAAGVMPGPV